ncbi:DUF397 domain-containing protein [Streptosporangium sp. NPDC050855]|uniref:DUF397 domain-containing protein n=1 Tax=Streptosporangium sp. NPDC050855 TaxID=3366194 RepID=UPI0037A16A9A
MDLTKELENAVRHKATKSASNQDDCLEVAPLSGGRVGLRDTEAPEKAPFVVSAGIWDAFVDGAKKGEFDF